MIFKLLHKRRQPYCLHRYEHIVYKQHWHKLFSWLVYLV